jgi:hypothetical protein
MNMRLYMVVAGALTSLALLACSSDTSDTGVTGGAGTAGSGNQGGSGNTGNEGGAGAMGGAGTGGTGGAAGCRVCAVYFTDAISDMTLMPDGDPLCEPESAALWKALLDCGCGACTADCSAMACEGGMAADDTKCGDCLSATFTGDGACTMEAGECSNDAG